tara:strand:+ start:4787 stop:5341 length:555 start_codon:yes stop_codon:yes gene_type:complete
VASGVRDAASAAFLDHVAGCVRNTSFDSFTLPGAGGVRHAFGDTAFDEVACRVRNTAVLGFFNHFAGRVRHTSSVTFFDHRAGCVRNAFLNCARDLLADSVRNSSCFDAGFVSNAADFFLHSFRAPDLTADSVSTAAFGHACAVRAVIAIATAFGTFIAATFAAAVNTSFCAAVESTEVVHVAA